MTCRIKAMVQINKKDLNMKNFSFLLLLLTLTLTFSTISFAQPSSPEIEKGMAQGWAGHDGYKCRFFCKKKAQRLAYAEAEKTAQVLCSNRGGIPGDIVEKSIVCKDFIEVNLCTAEVAIECSKE